MVVLTTFASKEETTGKEIKKGEDGAYVPMGSQKDISGTHTVPGVKKINDNSREKGNKSNDQSNDNSDEKGTVEKSGQE